MQKLFTYLLFLLIVSTAHAQTKLSKTLQPAMPEAAGMSADRLKRIDTMLNGWIERGRTNGAVALLLRDGKIVYHKAFGFDDEEKNNRCRPTIFFVSRLKQKPSLRLP